MSTDKPFFNVPTIVAAVAGGSLAVERTNNGWLNRQNLHLKRNDQKIQQEQRCFDKEAAAQTRILQTRKAEKDWMLRKSAETRKIYSDFNKKVITKEQKDQLIYDLNKINETKLISLKKQYESIEAPDLKENINISQKPISVSLNIKNTNEFLDNKNTHFAEHQSNFVENEDFELIPLEPYPTSAVIFSALLGALGGLLVQKVAVWVIYKIEIYWSKKN